MFSERKDNILCLPNRMALLRVTLVVQRATEVTDMPSVP
jgi:hypothetical protein